jgi:hypothetical protein
MARLARTLEDLLDAIDDASGPGRAQPGGGWISGSST